jgi:hypothetical protein
VASTLFVLGQATENEFTTEDWLVPLITAIVGFSGAVLGVIVGQRLSRATQLELENERGERERQLELDKDQRSQAAEQRAAERAEAGERRRVRAICRVLEIEFAQIKMALNVCARRGLWWPEDHGVEVALPLDDRRLLAAWTSDHTWEMIALTEAQIVAARNQRADQVRSKGGALETDFDFADLATSVQGALDVLNKEQETLRAQGV